MPEISRNRQNARYAEDVVNVKDFGAVGDGVTDDTSAIQAAELSAASSGAKLLFPDGSYLVTSTINKSDTTYWEGVMSNRATGNLGAVINSTQTGTCVSVTGNSTNSRGGFKGIRFINTNIAAYPNAKGIVFASTVLDNIIEDCYVGNFGIGVEVDGSKAIYQNRVYVFGCLTYGCHVKNGATDCWFLESQYAGDTYGLYLDGTTSALASMTVTACRPQVSGVANMRADNVTYLNINGGYNDTAINHPNKTGRGLEIVDCLNFIVNGVTFYSNGNAAPHIYIDSDSGDLCLDGIISNNTVKQSGSNTGTIAGIEFGTCAGTCKRISINNNNLYDVDQSIKFNTVVGTLSEITIGDGNILEATNQIVNPDNVAHSFYIGTPQNKKLYESYFGRTTDIVLDSNYAPVQRLTGTMNTSFNIDLPTEGNYAGRTIKIVRLDGGTGTISIRDNGANTRHQLTGANQWVELVAIGTGTTWVELSSDDLTR